MQSVEEFVTNIEVCKIKLWTDGNKLSYKAPTGAITPDILQVLRDRKQEIIDYLMIKDSGSIYLTPIEKAKPKEYHPLSAAQLRMFLLGQIDENSTAYNLTQVLKIEGEVDRDQLTEILNRLVTRHDSLRTAFLTVGGNPVQRIYETIDFKLEYHEIKNTLESMDQAIQELITPYDLSKPPLFKFKLVKILDDSVQPSYLLIQDMHHIISDGVSEALLVQEVNQLFAKQRLPELKIQYKDYVYWQQKLLSSYEILNQKKYWLEQLKQELPLLNLPTDYPRPQFFTFNGESIKIQINRDLADKLNRLAKENRVTLFSVLFSLYSIILFKYTGQTEIVIGTPTAGRRHADTANIIGVFVNTLALKVSNQPGKRFVDYLQDMGKQLIQAFDNQDYPFENLVEDLNIRRDLSRNPIFDTMFILQNMNVGEITIEGLSIKRYQYQEKRAQLDLTLVGTENKDGIEIEFNYCTSLFTKKTIEQFGAHFVNLLKNVTANPQVNLSAIEMITEEEKQRILYDFNNTRTEYPTEKTIPELFEAQVERTPDNIAVIFGDQQLTYRELNGKANQLAGILREKGVGPDIIVGIMVHRSLEMIIGLCGILKAGGAYLPIDPEYPEKRIQYMLEDSRANILLSQGYLKDKIGFNGEIIEFDNDTIYQGPTTNLPKNNQAKDLAYLIYTSGSTGKPKGVMITHQSVHNFMVGIANRIKFSAEKAILVLTTISFDIFGLETLLPLTRGLKIVIADEVQQVDAFLFNELVIKNQIRMLQITPSRIKLFLSVNPGLTCLKQLTEIMIGGEEFPENLLGRLSELTSAKIFNMYGPTETTIWSTIKELTDGTGINIGNPIANTNIFILDKHNALVPAGIAGELCISGDGLARGYLNRPELTTEKFTPNPFSQNQPIYRTGDLASWLPDGNISYLGRIDHQVKIRGYRIELKEIENHLLKYEAIKEAVVVTKEDKEKSKSLCAYLVVTQRLSVSKIREYLSRELPEYMIPSYFVQLENMPLTPNGKIDRKALPEPEGKINTGVEYIAPHSDLEKSIANIWKQLFEREQIGIHDNFFDIGGNSLLIIRLASLINQQLQMELKQEISINTLFQYPTISSLVQYLNPDQNQIDEERKELELRMNKTKSLLTQTLNLEIAVIGMAGKFPGADNIEEFWANLKGRVESIHFFSDQELIEAGIDEQKIKNPNYIKAKGIINKPDYFDASFFGYTPMEAQTMDPQFRLFHECVWEALENAGYDPYQYKGLIGLFAGASDNLYWAAINQLSTLHSHTATTFANFQLIDRDFFTTLISYKLNLKGPSMTIQTACSTSLMAVHIACQQLITGGCNIALAGGVSAAFPHNSGYEYEDGMINSRDGHCRAFDSQAQGTVFGEGVGVVVLKRLEEALEDGDHILAVIKGSDANNDGLAKVGYTAPSIQGQSQMIKKAYYNAEVEPETVTYIETHGTGTVLGDPIEIEALKIAFDTSKRNYCAIGSVKTNIGHLDAAAGVAGLIKTILSLQHKQIPPSLNFKSANPKIDFVNSPFFVNQELREWSDQEYPLRAGVSSFGIGGTNVHVILEEAPEREEASQSRSWQLLLLSAKTITALGTISENLGDYLLQNSEIDIADLAYTLQVGRAQLKNRRVIIAENVQDTIAQLQASFEPQIQTEGQTVVFMFPGQGSQYINMGRDLYFKEQSFSQAVDRCLAIIKPIVPYDLKDILYPDDARNINDMTDTNITQPLIFIFEYALAQLLMKWGIKPDVMIGHSIGEYVAACLAGVFSLEDALSIVAQRRELMQKLPAGAMLNVPLSEAELAPFINEEISLAAVNSSSLSVLSGSRDAIDQAIVQLSKIGCQGVLLNTSHAFHSWMMEPILEPFIEKMKQVRLNKPQIPFISNLTGNWITVQDAINPEYWIKHMRYTVKFADGLKELLKNDNSLFIEIGPGRELGNFVKQHQNYKQHLTVNLIRNPKEETDDQKFLLRQLGKLWSVGLKIDWDGFYLHEKRCRIPLPAYPFERQLYGQNLNYKDLTAELFSRRKFHSSRKELTEWFYIPTWKRIAAVEMGENLNPALNVLIFGNEIGFTTQIIAGLKQKLINPIIVKIGTQFQKENNSSYIINPGHPEDFTELFRNLAQSEQMPRVMIYTWTLSEDWNVEVNITKIEKAMELGFYSLIHLAQAIGALNHTNEIVLKILTNNLYNVSGAEKLCPEKAMVIGPLKVIPLEYPNLKCSNIDIEFTDSTNKFEKQLIEAILNDLADKSNNIIAYRGKFPWIPYHEPVKISKSQDVPHRLRENGVYLITGELGGIGLVIGEYLVQTVHANLVLIGRSNLPARNDWERWLSDHNENDKVSIKIRKIKELEEFGGRVLTISANIADQVKMTEVIGEITRELGAINGVIHCAGLADGKTIQLKDWDLPDQVLAPKVKGTVILNQLLKDMKLDFFIGCSSILAPFGQIGDCAANSFLDAFAYWKNSWDRTFTVAINWDTWQEVGIAVESAKLFNTDDTLGNGILPSEGIEVLKRILDSDSLPPLGINQIIISTIDLEERHLEMERPEIPEINSTFRKNKVFYQRPDLPNTYVAPSDEIEQKLADIWRDFFGISEIGIDDNYFELGGDSLKATILITNINKEFNLSLTVQQIFIVPTIRELAVFINENIALSPKSNQDHQGSHSSFERIEKNRSNGSKEVADTFNSLSQEIMRGTEESRNGVKNIEPVHFDGLDCLEDQIVSIAAWAGRTNYPLIFSESWRFNFEIESGGTFAERIKIDDNNRELLEKYCGIKISPYNFMAEENPVKVINSCLQEETPVIIGINSFWCPWDDNYQKTEHIHFCIVERINYDTKELLCVDAWYQKRNLILPFSHLIKGAELLLKLAISNNDIEQVDYKRLILNQINQNRNSPNNCENIFQMMRIFAKTIVVDSTFVDEMKKTSVFWEAPLFLKIQEIQKDRSKYSKFLEYVSENSDFNFSREISLFISAAMKWSTAKSLFVKATFSDFSIITKKLNSTIEEIADFEENIIRSLLETIEGKSSESTIYYQRLSQDSKIDDLNNAVSDFVFLDLSRFLNNKGLDIINSIDSNADLTGNGQYILADDKLNCETINLWNMYFKIPPIANDKNDNMVCANQTIQVPSDNNYHSILILGCTAWDDMLFNIELNYENGMKANLEIGISQWIISPIYGELVFWEGAGIQKIGERTDIMNKPVRIFAKKYSLPLDIPIESIKLPDCSNIHIFAISLEKKTE